MSERQRRRPASRLIATVMARKQASAGRANG